MLRTLSALRQHIITKRKSPKVADETMFSNMNADGAGMPLPVYANDMNRTARPHHTRNGLAVISTIVRIPFSILSCFSQHHGNAADAMWVTGETFRTSSEIDHLMISDSMRYAILM
ncbi:hypothetical protein SOVF_124300 [Spinacia oleracea]|uniref:Uncharacterized protein n=1 Tax=Spinacia oleracea TaxID=3562 RepID=A0A9R0JC36_SPIOL|nr:uncharacterized protein LOC110803842 [Spinacia oleracea]KNA12629.1 hypothetical protein SOVF_124300 [Spinacia oleracea]